MTMRYECIHCGQGGASSRSDPFPPPHYNCHGCGAARSMWPVEHVKVLASMRVKFLQEVEKILAGIDRKETDDLAGWWETSTGAEFGARKLEEVRALLNRGANTDGD